MFESLFSEFDELQDCLSDVTDKFDLDEMGDREWSDLIALNYKFTDNSGYYKILDRGDNLIFHFIHKSKIENEVDRSISFFIRKVETLNSIVKGNKVMIINNHRTNKEVYENRHGYDVTVNIVNFSCYSSSLVEFLIVSWNKQHDKSIIEKLSEMDINKVIRKSLSLYCNRHHLKDLGYLEAFRNSKDKLLKPVHGESIPLPHNLDRQFVYDIFPIFFKHVYDNSGLIFRMKYYKGRHDYIFRKDRHSVNIISELDNSFKEYKLDLKLDDVLIPTDDYGEYDYDY